MPILRLNRIQQDLNKARDCASALTSPRSLGTSGITEQRGARRDLVDGLESLYLSRILWGAS